MAKMYNQSCTSYPLALWSHTDQNNSCLDIFVIPHSESEYIYSLVDSVYSGSYNWLFTKILNDGKNVSRKIRYSTNKTEVLQLEGLSIRMKWWGGRGVHGYDYLAFV